MCNKKYNSLTNSNYGKVCRLCSNYINAVTVYGDKVVDDNPIIAQTENFFLVPDMHPVSKGHLLIVSKQHYRNMASLPPNILSELKQLCEYVYSVFKKYISDDCVAFEHGSADDTSTSLNSINHFHLHIIAYDKDLAATVQSQVRCKCIEISGFEDVKRFKDKDYIFIYDSKQKASCLLFEKKDVCSQLVRKLVFSDCGDKNGEITYDWKIGIDNIRYSVSADMLKRIFKKQDSGE